MLCDSLNYPSTTEGWDELAANLREHMVEVALEDTPISPWSPHHPNYVLSPVKIQSEKPANSNKT